MRIELVKFLWKVSYVKETILFHLLLLFSSNFFLDKKVAKNQDLFSFGIFSYKLATCQVISSVPPSELPDWCPQFIAKKLPPENRSEKFDQLKCLVF